MERGVVFSPASFAGVDSLLPTPYSLLSRTTIASFDLTNCTVTFSSSLVCLCFHKSSINRLSINAVSQTTQPSAIIFHPAIKLWIFKYQSPWMLLFFRSQCMDILFVSVLDRK